MHKPPPQPPVKPRQRRRAWRLVLGLFLLLAAVAGAFWAGAMAGDRRENNRAVSEPFMVQIVAWHPNPAHPVRRFEVRSPRAIVEAQSLLSRRKRVRQDAPGRVQYTIQLHCLGDDQTEPYQIWSSDGGQLWTDGSGTYELHGDIAAWLAALPAQRMAQLLTSQQEGERKRGLQWREFNGDAAIDALLALAKSDNAQLQSGALDDLAVLLSDEPPSWEYPRWHVMRPTRCWDHPRAAEARQLGLALLSSSVEQPLADAASDRQGVILDVCELLAEVGDLKTADQVAPLLAQAKDPYVLEQLLSLLGRLHALPPVLEPGGICGNSSPEELAQYAEQHMKRLREGRDKLLQWHQEQRALDRDEQLRRVLDQWRDMVRQLGSEGGFIDAGEATPDARFQPLLRLGRELLPRLATRKQQAADLAEQGGWELLRACLVADCDQPLVQRLLEGGMQQRIIACYIIAASRQPQWRQQLDRLQYQPLPEGTSNVTVEEVVALRGAASAALMATHGPAAWPLVRAAYEAGFESLQAWQVLAYYGVPH